MTELPGVTAVQGFNFANDLEVHIPAGGTMLKGCLHVPAQAKMLVITVRDHETPRTSAHDPHSRVHDRYVARVFNGHQIATLCIDLIAEEEQKTGQRELLFDTLLLAGRLDRIAEWVRRQPALRNLKLGYFCASTCAGAALIAAAQHPGYVVSIVCYGGRPDLAGAFLPKVKVPTLLLVGESDKLAIELNRQSLAQLNTESKLDIIPDATHSFEGPGALEEMMRHAVAWFTHHANSPDDTRQSA